MSAEKALLGDEYSTFSRDNVHETGACLNHDIIEHLCKYLGTMDIKTCRLVSSVWNYGSTLALKARTNIRFQLSPKNCKNSVPLSQNSGGWDILNVIEKLKFCPVNVCLLVPFNSDDTLAPPDFSLFPETNNFKSICVELPHGNQYRWQAELVAQLIQSSSTTLKELEFDWAENVDFLDFPSFGDTIFPKLVKLTVENKFDEGAVERVFQAITTSFPNLQYLVTECKYFVEIVEEGLLPNLPQSLNCLNLYGNITPDRMESLLKIPAGLKKFTFGGFNPVFLQLDDDDEEDELQTILYKLLKKQAPTLEKFSVGIVWWDRAEMEIEWKFPIFPFVKKLYIDFSRMQTRIVFETKLESGDFRPINYAECFPVLEFINCAIPEESWVESFLPSKGNCQVVTSVRKVDVTIYADYGEGELHTKIYEQLWDMFPNARDFIIIRRT
ncbi:uncharacterized protein LOC118433492 [Folsomia candida]|uniref:uncharacterized protein LOC118433492 n=1 Tax=Folsomia candida TaxID=158441 RepID=UPI00160549E5|nr:uncharacterized protein LOC118433492 [Folsomia candida]